MVSVYVKYRVSKRRRESECYFILFQSISKTLCSLVTNPLAVEVQCGEYLYEEIKEVKWSKDSWIIIITKPRCVPTGGRVTSHKVLFLFCFHYFKHLIASMKFNSEPALIWKSTHSLLRKLISLKKRLISLPILFTPRHRFWTFKCYKLFKESKIRFSLKIVCAYICFTQ